MNKQTVVFGSNSSQYAWLTRAKLMQVLMTLGYRVVLLAPEDDFSPKLTKIGVDWIPLPMKMDTNPVTDAALLLAFWRNLRAERPVAYLGFTAKPNIYGSLAARALGIAAINNIAGLGTAFIKKSVLTRLVRALYRIALAGSFRVFFQNDDDCALFRELRVLRHDRYDILPGSGVDLNKFSYTPLPARAPGEKFRFLLVGRMLWDKGVGEYVVAARILLERHPNVEFCLLGALGVDNPSAIQRQQMDEWVAEGVVNYLGFREDVLAEIVASDCVVLPSSYREGTPRTLLEACAVGRPIIATDAVGCRDVVDDGKNGLLCKLKDEIDLAEKMEHILVMSEADRTEMGRAGRRKMEREYDETIVIDKYIETIGRAACGANR